MTVLIDWVKQGISGEPGTGAITLGNAHTGFIRFQDSPQITDGTLVYYEVSESINREYGIGTYNSGVLSRTTILATLDSNVYTKNPATGIYLTSAGVVYSAPVPERLNFRGAFLYRTTALAVTYNVTTTVPWEAVYYDTDGFSDLVNNADRLTVPAGVSAVRVFFGFDWQYEVDGSRVIDVLKNGAYVRGGIDEYMEYNWGGEHSTASAVIPVVEGDYFQARVRTYGSGVASPLNLEPNHNTYFAMEVVE